MENNRFFLWIVRINSLLFLLLLLAGLVMVAISLFESSSRSERRGVEVVKEPGKPVEKERFTLSGINNICGHDAKYVKLQTERSSKGFSSGYSGGKTRNLIFFTGSKREAHWLFEKNQYLIQNVSVIPADYSGCEEAQAAIIYYDLVKQDSDGDGVLSGDDSHTLAITDPYGRGYRELVTGAEKVLDFEFDEGKQQINLLLQMGNEIVLRDYSLKGDLLAESRVTDLSGR